MTLAWERKQLQGRGRDIPGIFGGDRKLQVAAAIKKREGTWELGKRSKGRKGGGGEACLEQAGRHCSGELISNLMKLGCSY